MSNKGFSVRAESILVTCPKCGAFRGSMCRTLTSERMTRFHIERAKRAGYGRPGRAKKRAA